MMKFCVLDPFYKGNPNIETIRIDTKKPGLLLNVTLKPKKGTKLDLKGLWPSQLSELDFEGYMDAISITFFKDRLSKELQLKAECAKEKSLSKNIEQTKVEWQNKVKWLADHEVKTKNDVKAVSVSKLSFLGGAKKSPNPVIKETQIQPVVHSMITRSKAPMITRSKAAARKF